MTTDRRQVTLRPARRSDQEAVERLLRELELPTSGVAEWLEGFWLAEHDGRIVGLVGLEQYGDGALLRSVAVDPRWRSAGLGRALVDLAVETARSAGARDVYLLTTTAERYFPRLGFERITRAEVPMSVQASVEFQGACPASAVVMRRSLAAAAHG